MTLQYLKDEGFAGFLPIRTLASDFSMIPEEPGVYMILTVAQKTPEFLAIGTGGHFKKRNPNVPIEKLRAKWVNNSAILYIGKAGGNYRSTLRSRLAQYFRFGNGQPIGHWGGRYIWQLSVASNLLVCWKPTKNKDPRTIEKQLIESYQMKYSCLPFANLKL